MRNVRRFSPCPPPHSFRWTSAPGRFPPSRRGLLPPVLGGVKGTLPEVPSEEERWEQAGEGSAAEGSGRFGTPASFSRAARSSRTSGASVCRHAPHSFPVLPSSLVELAEIPDLCVCLGFVLNCMETMCVTRIMRVDLCAVSQLLHFLTTKRDIPEDLLIKGSFRAQRCRTHRTQRSTTSPGCKTIQEYAAHFCSAWIWMPVVHFLVVSAFAGSEFANKLDSCDLPKRPAN